MTKAELDAILTDYVARPFVWVFLWFDRLERRWTNLLRGTKPEPVAPAAAEEKMA